MIIQQDTKKYITYNFFTKIQYFFTSLFILQHL